MGGRCCTPIRDESQIEEIGESSSSSESSTTTSSSCRRLDQGRAEAAKAAEEGILCFRELLRDGLYDPSNTANFEHKALSGILMRDVYNLFDSHLGMHLAPEILGTEPQHPARSYMPILYTRLLRSQKLSPEWTRAVQYMKSISPRESLNRLAHMFTEELPGESLVVLAGKDALIDFVISGLPAEDEHRLIFDLCASYPPLPRPIGFNNKRESTKKITRTDSDPANTKMQLRNNTPTAQPEPKPAAHRKTPQGRSRSPRRPSPKRRPVRA